MFCEVSIFEAMLISNTFMRKKRKKKKQCFEHLIREELLSHNHLRVFRTRSLYGRVPEGECVSRHCSPPYITILFVERSNKVTLFSWYMLKSTNKKLCVTNKNSDRKTRKKKKITTKNLMKATTANSKRQKKYWKMERSQKFCENGAPWYYQKSELKEKRGKRRKTLNWKRKEKKKHALIIFHIHQQATKKSESINVCTLKKKELSTRIL